MPSFTDICYAFTVACPLVLGFVLLGALVTHDQQSIAMISAIIGTWSALTIAWIEIQRVL